MHAGAVVGTGLVIRGEAQTLHGLHGDIIEGLAHHLVHGGTDDASILCLVTGLPGVLGLAGLVALVVAVGHIVDLNPVFHTVVDELHRAGQRRAAVAHDKVRKGFVGPLPVAAQNIGGIMHAVHQRVVNIAHHGNPLALVHQLLSAVGRLPVITRLILGGVSGGGHLIHVLLGNVECLHHQRMGLSGHLPCRGAHQILIVRHRGVDSRGLLQALHNNAPRRAVVPHVSANGLSQSPNARHGNAILHPQRVLVELAGQVFAVHHNFHIGVCSLRSRRCRNRQGKEHYQHNSQGTDPFFHHS